MSLGDVMTAAGLTVYAEVGLLLFLAAFVAVGIAVFRSKNHDSYERARWLPFGLEDEAASRCETGGGGQRPVPECRRHGTRERR